MVASLVYRSILDGLHGGCTSMAIALIVNSLCGYLYYYGRLRQTMIWSPDFTVATTSHACMHILVATGYTTLLYVYPDDS
jgi:hypothetical protein